MSLMPAATRPLTVMAGLDPAIHAAAYVDGRVKPGHDESFGVASSAGRGNWR
jgi:hypothetical protein